MAFEYHPDRNMDNPRAAAENFKEIQKAWEILRDSEKRKEYDLLNRDSFVPNRVQYRHRPSSDEIFSASARSAGLEGIAFEAYTVVYPHRGPEVTDDFNDLLRFQNKYQLEALKHAAPVRGDSITLDYDELLKFDNLYQVDALKYAAPARREDIYRDYDKLLKFENHYQVDALKYAATAREDAIVYDYGKLLKFSNTYQAEALRIMAETRPDLIYPSYEKILQFAKSPQNHSTANRPIPLRRELPPPL